MKRAAFVFIIAVFLPSLLLAWLAVRSLRDQQFILERQQMQVHQGVVDGVAKDIEAYLAEQQREFARQVQACLAGSTPRAASAAFHEKLTRSWPLAELGFAVSLRGEVLAPSMFAGAEERKFRVQNDVFLCSKESVEVYWNSPKGIINLSRLDRPGEEWPKTGFDSFNQKAVYATKGGNIPEPAASHQPLIDSASETEFRQLIAGSSEGSIARFLENKLRIWFWRKPEGESDIIFGVQLKLEKLVENLRRAFEQDAAKRPDLCLVLLDDANKVAASSLKDFSITAKKPSVTAEIGQTLPHWIVAGYILSNDQLNASVRTVRLTFGMVIGLLVGAIAVGGWLITLDLRRQILISRQKTDFVSNVSHELKTPLTSIRMFSEMLAEGTVQDRARQKSYLQIIAAETSRLARLINNVLDFSSLDRGAKKFQLKRRNLVEIVSETVDACLPQLQAACLEVSWTARQQDIWVNVDSDAIAQVLVNLFSNAEKYAGSGRELQVEAMVSGGKAFVSVLDRGPGAPAGAEEKIFEQFYRGHDALDSGAQGSGLGLTLARKIARAHGGDVAYSRREGGGSVYTLSLPVAASPASTGKQKFLWWKMIRTSGWAWRMFSRRKAMRWQVAEEGTRRWAKFRRRRRIC
jgi:signal transduction histidine kinase